MYISMQLLDIVAKFFLIFGQEFVLIPLIIFGFLALNKKTYGHAIFLLLFTMIFSAFLKSIFQIPLAEHLNKTGYAFPSGHMQTAIVFYGWLFIAHKNTLVRSLVSIILLGIGFALIQQKYHNLYDVLGAVLFGLLTLFVYTIVLQIKLFMNKPFLLGYMLIALSIGLLFSMDSLLQHTSMAFMVLAGFTLSWTIFSDSIEVTLSFVRSMIGFFSIIGVYFLALQIKHYTNLEYDIQWLIIGISIPLTAKILKIKQGHEQL
jgi:hypothetical protein